MKGLAIVNPPVSYEWLCERIVADSQASIIFADEQGIIRLWNSGAEAMFGFTAAEAVGVSMDIIIPERQRAKHWQGYHHVMATGVTRYGREVLAVPAVRKDGQRISIEFTISLLRAPSGAVLGAAAIVQDVTARWEREKALRARVLALETQLSESEQRKTARELTQGTS
jgi:PAS domain S-box-containing protein